MRISDWSSDVCSSDLAVDLVVRRHHRRNAGAADHFLERREEILAQFAFGKRRGADIGAALGLAVPGQVQIGSASCMERVCPYVSISVVVDSYKKNDKKRKHEYICRMFSSNIYC